MTDPAPSSDWRRLARLSRRVPLLGDRPRCTYHERRITIRGGPARWRALATHVVAVWFLVLFVLALAGRMEGLAAWPLGLAVLALGAAARLMPPGCSLRREVGAPGLTLRWRRWLFTHELNVPLRELSCGLEAAADGGGASALRLHWSGGAGAIRLTRAGHATSLWLLRARLGDILGRGPRPPAEPCARDPLTGGAPPAPLRLRLKRPEVAVIRAGTARLAAYALLAAAGPLLVVSWLVPLFTKKWWLVAEQITGFLVFVAGTIATNLAMRGLRTRIKFDRAAGTLSARACERWRNERVRCPLSDVVALQLAGSQPGPLELNAVLAAPVGMRVHLLGSRDAAGLRRDAARLAQFLDLPLLDHATTWERAVQSSAASWDVES